MMITFPHLGNSSIAIKSILDELDLDYILPPISNKTSLEIGSYYSPEEICLPFKIMLGGFIQSIKNGADTIIIPGSCGPCRFGEYGELLMITLSKAGYNVNFIVLDYPKDIGFREFIRRFTKITSKSHKSIKQKFIALKNAYKIITLIDNIEQKLRLLSGYEVIKGECSSLLNKCKVNVLKSNTIHEMLSTLYKYNDLIYKIKIDKSKTPLKIAIIGEIYTILEPFSNLYIEDKLMKYGASTKRYLYPSWWLNNMILSPIKLNSLDIKKLSSPYLSYSIGGFARECIGEAILAKKQGFHGAIQVLPMGCMPEIVSKSILTSISKNENFPIMTLVVDELTGEEGFNTRIEAFLDLLERREFSSQSFDRYTIL